MNLYAVVFVDELEADGRSAVFFNTRTPNTNFKHFSVVQDESGAQQRTMKALLAKVREEYPQAREEYVERTTWILRE